ncbi:rsbT co-antagonist protein RsbR [Psychrobacillus sp. OK028]|uniref:STAS domain-containing protein n=1 Tax=Psychrobacillus sp. OK028 TaxID=1884359 RepID=UPI00088612EB|nr:STAS domain-containing protein [Psychrobacillus sp. OK028]SDM40996.1 rsbT co-antagonist protein RsbR [Psychrobacillus sp. OK028]
MEPILKVSNYLVDNAETIINEILDVALKNVTIKITPEELERAIQKNIQFLKLLSESLQESTDSAEEVLKEWSKQNGEEEAKVFDQFSSVMKPYAINRLLFLQKISKIAMDHGLSTEDVVYVNNRFCYLMDLSMIETIQSYESYRDKLMKDHQKEINELSAPIVPIQDGVAVLPLIGAIDYTRVQHLLNYVVPTIPSLKVDHLIIDFSGILAIDTEIAQHIFTIHNVLGLLGIHVLFSGIRPNLSMTVVKAGIDFTSFNTYGSVKQAIDSLKL